MTIMVRMIRAIKKTEYMEVKDKERYGFFGNITVFKGVDGKYYASDKRGAAAVKEALKKQAQLKKNISDQLTLV